MTSVFEKSDYSDLFGTVPGNHSALIKTYKNNIWFCCSFAYCATFFLVETWCLVLAKPGKPLAMSQVVERYPPLVLRQDEQEKVSTCTDMQQTCKMSSMFVGFCSNKNLQVEHLDQRMTKDMVQICPSPKQSSLRRRHYGITVIVINMWINMWCFFCCSILFTDIPHSRCSCPVGVSGVPDPTRLGVPWPSQESTDWCKPQLLEQEKIEKFTIVIRISMYKLYTFIYIVQICTKITIRNIPNIGDHWCHVNVNVIYLFAQLQVIHSSTSVSVLLNLLSIDLSLHLQQLWRNRSHWSVVIWEQLSTVKLRAMPSMSLVRTTMPTDKCPHTF